MLPLKHNSQHTGLNLRPTPAAPLLLQVEPVVLEPTRLSSRIRGEAAPSLQQAAAEAQREAAAAAAEEEEEGLGKTRKGTARKRLTLDKATYVAPFTLWSIGERSSRGLQFTSRSAARWPGWKAAEGAMQAGCPSVWQTCLGAFCHPISWGVLGPRAMRRNLPV